VRRPLTVQEPVQRAANSWICSHHSSGFRLIDQQNPFGAQPARICESFTAGHIGGRPRQVVQRPRSPHFGGEFRVECLEIGAFLHLTLLTILRSAPC